VKEAFPDNRSDVHFCADPLGTLASDAFLLKLIGGSQDVVFNPEGFPLPFLWVNPLNEARFPEKKPQALCLIELFLQRFVCINSEVG
jgi:hypothetical protein